jgi:hypothetical protein
MSSSMGSRIPAAVIDNTSTVHTAQPAPILQAATLVLLLCWVLLDFWWGAASPIIGGKLQGHLLGPPLSHSTSTVVWPAWKERVGSVGWILADRGDHTIGGYCGRAPQMGECRQHAGSSRANSPTMHCVCNGRTRHGTRTQQQRTHSRPAMQQCRCRQAADALLPRIIPALAAIFPWTL